LEAIEKIKNDEYDIVFMDHMMPKMDGLKATKILRDLGYSRPIVALTANALVGQAEMYLSNGFDGFLPKPIDSLQLDILLTTFLRDRKPSEIVEAARREQLEKEAQR
jgi:CheY-like chemotaxis protein